MPLTPPNAMIFAAGKGSRMGALTAETPKPMLQVAGRPLIDHALDLTRDIGCPKTVVNLHTHAQILEHHLSGTPNLRTIYEPELLETGGGLRNALPLLGDGPVFTLNSDTAWIGARILEGLWQAWDPARMGALLLLVPPERSIGHSGFGDFTLQSDGQITRPGPLTYTGAQLIDPSGLHLIEESAFSLNAYWRILAAEGRLFGVQYTGLWADAGTPNGLKTATELLESHPV